MNKIKAIIVEDEKKGMDKIVAMLTDFCPNIEILDKCPTGKAAIQSIAEKRPDLVFMDIELGGMHGFDVLSSVRHIPFETIFTTAHEEYGIKAIKAGAIDYLLKPFSLEELKDAVHKVWAKINDAQKTSEEITKIKLPDTNGFILLDVDDIMYCQADNNAAYIHLLSKEKPLYIIKTLGKIYEKLPEAKFCRSSRSHIVNMNQVASYSRLDGGVITLVNGKKLATRPGVFRDRFLEQLGKY